MIPDQSAMSKPSVCAPFGTVRRRASSCSAGSGAARSVTTKSCSPGTDESKIPARQLLYRGRIAAQALRFSVQTLVRLPQFGDGVGQLPVLALNPEGGRQSPFADQRVRDQDGGQEAEQQPREMPSPPRALLPAARRGNLGPLRAGEGERRLRGPRSSPGAPDPAPPGRASCGLGHAFMYRSKRGPRAGLPPGWLSGPRSRGRLWPGCCRRAGPAGGTRRNEWPLPTRSWS